jgi:hypothetical protein
MAAERLITEVQDLCTFYRVRYFHSTDSRRDLGKGWPDYVIAGPSGIIFRECKGELNDVTAEQTAWKWTLRASGLSWDVWRPKDLASGRVEAEISALA